MELSKDRVFYLLDAYISKRSTVSEENELMEWLRKPGYHSELKDFVWDIWSRQHPEKRLSDADWDAIYTRAISDPKAAPSVKVRRMKMFRITAAAAAVIILFTGYYFYFSSVRESSSRVLRSASKDIAPPSGSKAVLILADGSSVEIDDAAKGTIAMQGNISIVKQSNGGVAYTGNGAKAIGYNTFSVPRGSKPLMLTLSDGTHVWLNVGSSLSFPTVFADKERRVTISGEAYFEVAHNEAMPFRVQRDDVTISVLGTHFNVNTYEDEATQEITLLEGSVRVSKKTVSQLLQPGQQASIGHGESADIKVSNEVNIEDVMAWKGGKFRFSESMDIRDIMRQISRWYNVNVEYKGKVDQRFLGSISKDINASQVLKILEAAGGVKFSIEGNKIVVMPAKP
ncbi:MAG: FecR domain-containing protein [Chitinophagaceae bacterium]|nr:FecR domain-containing protein [Chitinophagaceae bacterium]